MNTNLIHNILNVTMTAIAGLELLDLAPIVGTDKALMIIAVFGIVKIAINLLRDGLAGMAKEQPPVQ